MLLHEPIIYSTFFSPLPGEEVLVWLCFGGVVLRVRCQLCSSKLCGIPVVFLFSAGTKENGVINYLVSAGLRRESASINSNCLSFSVEERADTQQACTHSIRPPENAAGRSRCLKDSDFKTGFLNDVSQSAAIVLFCFDRQTLNATFYLKLWQCFNNIYGFASDFLWCSVNWWFGLCLEILVNHLFSWVCH